MRISRSLLLFPIMLFCSGMAGQRISQFSTDTAKFTRDLSQYMIEFSANKETAADYMRKFEKLWKDNVIAGYFKEVTMQTANTMLGKRMKPYPFFYGYLN